MKISFVLGHELPFPPEKGGGVNSLLYGLCRAFAKLGHEVTAYSPSVTDRPDIEFCDGIRHIRVAGAARRKSNIANVAAGLPYAIRVLRSLEPCDVLSCHLWHGFVLSRFRKAAVVTHTIHRDPKKFLLLFSLLDRIYTGSDAVTNDAARLLPSLAPKLRTVYNAVDFSSYDEPLPRESDGCTRYIFVGRFSADKGLETFLEAFCDAAALNKTIYFKSVGPMTAEGGGDEHFVGRMRDLVRRRGLSHRVEFAEPIYDRATLDDTIKGADIVVLPSIAGETLNMSILECMRLGKALLISDLPANAPLTLENITGFFAKTGDVVHWKECILRMAEHADTLAEMGRCAYAYGREKFSCEGVALEYIRDFETLMKTKGAVG